MVSPITLDALRVLDAIDRRGSFAAAAELLHRVPSAVSYTVQKLEDDLGVPLFDRSRRKAQLTDAGRLVLEQGRQILIATEELTALARQTGEGWEVELRICIDTILQPDSFYPLIERFQQLQPRTRLVLIEEVMSGSWDALNDNRCDLVIGAAGEPPVSGLVSQPLGMLEFVFTVAAGHPLTLLPQPLQTDAVRDHPTVVVADSSRNLPVRSSGLLDGRSRIVVPSISRKIEAQQQGLGVGYLPLHRIQPQLAAGQLQIVELETTRQPQAISVAWRSGRQGRALKWFVDQLRHCQFDSRLGLRLPD